MYLYFSTYSFAVKLFLLINLFSGTLIHYPIFMLPLDEFIANNKQTKVICIFLHFPSFLAKFMMLHYPFPAIYLKQRKLSNTNLLEMLRNQPAIFMNCTAT